MSLVEFKTVEHQGAKKAVASDEIKQPTLKKGIRNLEREMKVSRHTVEGILRGEPVRQKTLAKIMRQIQLSREAEQTKVSQGRVTVIYTISG